MLSYSSGASGKGMKWISKAATEIVRKKRPDLKLKDLYNTMQQ
jgi:hypothetical protein